VSIALVALFLFGGGAVFFYRRGKAAGSKSAGVHDASHATANVGGESPMPMSVDMMSAVPKDGVYDDGFAELGTRANVPELASPVEFEPPLPVYVPFQEPAELEAEPVPFEAAGDLAKAKTKP
jgi:hypothetical protein